MTNAELTLRWSGGELDLMGWNDGEHGDFLIETLTDGTEWGNPQTVRRALRRFLLDGSVSVKEYDDNRTISLRLRVKASDGNALAGGETALALTDSRRCELVWSPPDDFAAPAVFVAVSADLAHSMNDLGELRLERFYTLTLDCLPHAYSDEYVTISALPTGVSTPTVVDAGTSTTGWSVDSGTLSVVSGRVQVSGAAAGSVRLTRTGAIAGLATRPYLSINTSPATGYSSTIAEVAALVGATWTALPLVAVELGSNVFDATGFTTVDAVRITFVNNPAATSEKQAVNTVSTQSTPRTTATRQELRSIAAPGGVRTTGDILIESPSLGLGTVIAYSGPVYNPALGRGAQETRTSTSGTMSGDTSYMPHAAGDPVTPKHFRVNAADIPAGNYVVWTRYWAEAAGTLAVSVRLLDGTGALISSEDLGTVATPATGPGAFDFATILVGGIRDAGWNLPAGTDCFVEFKVEWSSSIAPAQDFFLDELWAFNVTEGSLSIIEAGSNKKVWLTPPDLTRDAPSVLLGSGEKTSAIPASLTSQLKAWSGSHIIQPPVAHLFTAVAGSPDAAVSARFRPAHHTHPTS